MPDGSCPSGHGIDDVTQSQGEATRRTTVSWGPIVVAALIVAWIALSVLVFFAIKSSTIGDRESGQRNPAVLQLGRTGHGRDFEYTPLEATRTSTVKDVLGADVSAGREYDFILVRTRIRNLSRRTQQVGWSFGDQPVVWATDVGTAPGRGLSGILPGRGRSSSEQFYFEEFDGYRDLRPGDSETGWLVFRVRPGLRDVSMKIEGNVWRFSLP